MDWWKLPNRIKKARALSPADWLALLEAWLTLPFYSLALAAVGYARWKDSIEEEDSPNRSESRDFARAERLNRLVRLAARIHFIPTTCLVRSLTLKNMLSRRNIPARIKIGARKESKRLRAHAWVEVYSMPIGEDADAPARFVPFAFANLNNRKFK